MKTAVIYARYSSDSQTEQSIEGQLHVCSEYAERSNIVILDQYIDRAMTGTNDNRPEFQRMIKDSNKKEWDFVLVYKLDRFSRNKYEIAKNKKILKDNNVKLLSAMENIPDTPEGIILESLLEGMAEYYSAELSQKVKRGMNETRQKGNFTGGTILYGFKVIDHKIFIEDEQAEIVKFIYEQYSKGVYIKDIIENLTQRRIFNKGKPFARNTIYNILKNEKYSGIYRFNNEEFTNMYPCIVPKDIYDKVRKKVDVNKYGKRSIEVNYLLRNKLICGYCNSHITAESGTSSKGKVKRYYKCIGRKHKNGCQKTMVRKELFEEFIIDTIIKELSKPKIIDTIVSNLMQIQKEQNKGSELLISLTKEQTQAQSLLDNVMKAIEQGIINNTTNKRMKELETKLEELDKLIIIEKSKSNIQLQEYEIKDYYLQALKLDSMMLINYVIDYIKVYEDKLEINFNSPLFENSVKEFSFLSINKKCLILYKINLLCNIRTYWLKCMFKTLIRVYLFHGELDTRTLE